MNPQQSTRETETIFRGKAAPGEKDFDKIASLIFGSANKRSVKFVIGAKGKKPPVTIHCIARHKDITAVLTGAHKNKVDLSHYDDLLGSAAQDVRFFLGVNSDDQKQRWEILSKAMGVDPAISRTNIQQIDEIATKATSTANSHHFHGKSSAGEFNAVREYGYFIPYLAAKEFVGLELPQKPSFWLWAFIKLRNIAAPGSVKLEGEITPAMRLLLWSHMVFGHLFANIGDRKALISKLASGSAKSYSAHISQAYKNADATSKNSLLNRFKQVRQDFPNINDAEYERHVRSIVFEFCGAMQILVGTSFANILAIIYDHDIELPRFLELLKDKGDVVLDEALRLNPTTSTVYRVAIKEIKIGDQVIKPGELICLMIGHGCKDPDVFDSPDRFSVDPADGLKRDRLDYLNFGPNEAVQNPSNPTDNTHPCFGQYWARTLLKSMLTGLAQFPKLEPKLDDDGTVLSRLGGIPDSLQMTFEKPTIKQQNFVTVCSAIPKNKNDELGNIRKEIEALGNPAHPEVERALGEDGLIHFMSINLVEGGEGTQEPAHIFMELSVDGGAEPALRSLCRHASKFLAKTYSTAGIVEVKANGRDQAAIDQEVENKLLDHLLDNNITLIQSVWPEFYSGRWRNGLGFTGTPTLSIQQIKDEQELSEFAESALNDLPFEETPLKTINGVRDKLAAATGSVAAARNRWVHQDLEPPVFGEETSSPWKSVWSKATFVANGLPAMIKIWLILLFLANASLIWALLYPDTASISALYDANTARNAVAKDVWQFPSMFNPPTRDSFIFIGAGMLLMGALIAFIASIFISWLSSKMFPEKSGRMGAIFAFVLIAFAFVSMIPNSNTGGIYNLHFGKLYINEFIWVWSLVATLILGAATAIFDRRAFVKSASALSAFGVMSLLVLTIGDLHIRLMATEPSVLKASSWALDGFVINRWDSASLGQMIFYPLLWSSIVSASVFAFNASYPKFRFFTNRNIYVGLFLFSFVFFFISSFYTADWPSIGRLGSFALAFILAIPATLTAIGIIAFGLWAILRRSEKNNTPIDRDPDPEVLEAMMERENHAVTQNHMISVQRLVPEQFRKRFFLPLAMHLVAKILGHNRYRPGFLATVGTVHFARWVHIAKTNNFVFVSNFDGSWESYLEDFITKSSMGMTAIWSNCVGFPKTEGLIKGGADDGDRFKRTARSSMIPTSFWYSAYPHISAEQIRQNSLIRDGLARISTPSDAQAWIDLFGSIPRPQYALQADKIQSLVFGGSGKLKCGRCLVIKNNTEGGVDPYFRKWLSEIEREITFGDSPPQDHAIYLGLSADGLARLGCQKGLVQPTGETQASDADCIKFPTVFTLGMDSPSRNAILGDLEGGNIPSAWDWGNQKQPAHAVLLIYGKMNGQKESAEFKKLLARHKKLITQNKLVLTKEIEFDPPVGGGFPKEPFGFADGISQPLIKGTRQASARSNSIHAVEPGEFILGYKDNRGFYPPSPQVIADLDEDHILPSIPSEDPQRYPKFHDENDEKYRDLGRNGTFMVIRQLEQDIDGFNAAMTDLAKKTCVMKDPEDKKEVARNTEMIKAKMMGRWPNGHSLMTRPIKVTPQGDKFKLERFKSSRPMTRQDNEFLYGKEDPQGHKCPFGSHVRRANPRDGLDVENPDGLSIANRHRLLRRGRSYIDKSDKTPKKGIMFLCLNADIERQFEFVQQTWIGSCKFHGLNDEIDPITGQGYYQIDPVTKKKVFKTGGLGFTIQHANKSKKIGSFKSFVTVKGGGYFFAPGKDALKFIVESANNPHLSKCPDQEKQKKKSG